MARTQKCLSAPVNRLADIRVRFILSDHNSNVQKRRKGAFVSRRSSRRYRRSVQMQGADAFFSSGPDEQISQTPPPTLSVEFFFYSSLVDLTERS